MNIIININSPASLFADIQALADSQRYGLGEVERLEIGDIRMGRGASYGHYFTTLSCTIDGQPLDVSTTSTDAQSFDDFCEMEEGSDDLSLWQAAATIEVLESREFDAVLDEVLDRTSDEA
jgi:hypothetical protein